MDPQFCTASKDTRGAIRTVAFAFVACAGLGCDRLPLHPSDANETDTSRVVHLDAGSQPDVIHAVEFSATSPAPISWRPPTIYCRNKVSHALVPLNPCPVRIAERIERWQPDTIVVLGGGLLRNGQANCATAERGYVAAQLFMQLSTRPTMVFTGRASRWIRRRLDEFDLRCVQASVAQGLPGIESPAWTRQQGTPILNASYAVSEAETLCATMLRTLPESEREGALAHAKFEVRARDTVENARKTRQILLRTQAQRVLILTSPFINHERHTYQAHGDRALHAFRALRRGAPYALASFACPRHRGTTPYWYFESLEPGGEPDRSRTLTGEQMAIECQ